jgi:hypothetical protein
MERRMYGFVAHGINQETLTDEHYVLGFKELPGFGRHDAWHNR